MLDDLRKAIEATIDDLTPARARSLAKSLAGPGAAKDQVAKSATDLFEWSQKNRERIREFVRREVSAQLGLIGVATQADIESLNKRVRALERAAGKGGSQPPGARTKTASRKSPGTSSATKKKAASASSARAGAKGTSGGARARA